MLQLLNDHVRVVLSPLGGKIVSVVFDGVDLVVGPGSDEESLASDTFTGAITGRFAGRITQAQYTLDGVQHKLVANMGPDQLHGGPENFSNATWQAVETEHGIRFSLLSPDGDQGHPGALAVTANYALHENVLSLDFVATTTKPTVINLTNHAYWNLAGRGSGLAQEVEIPADGYLPLNVAKLPSGEIRDVSNTAFDFRKMRAVAKPYDCCFCLPGKRGILQKALTMRDSQSGRRMEVYTTEPAIQIYTADHFNRAMPGKNGPMAQHNSIAIEPQNYPDAPNHQNFPSSVLRPGETYHHRIEWRFFTAR